MLPKMHMIKHFLKRILKDVVETVLIIPFVCVAAACVVVIFICLMAIPPLLVNHFVNGITFNDNLPLSIWISFASIAVGMGFLGLIDWVINIWKLAKRDALMGELK